MIWEWQQNQEAGSDLPDHYYFRLIFAEIVSQCSYVTYCPLVPSFSQSPVLVILLFGRGQPYKGRLGIQIFIAENLFNCFHSQLCLQDLCDLC